MLKRYLEVYLILCKFHEKNVQSLAKISANFCVQHFKCMSVDYAKLPPMLFVSSKI